MTYIYFVSYFTQTGSGNAQMTLEAEITTIKQIRNIEKWIREHVSEVDVSVINYVLLRKEQPQARTNTPFGEIDL
jgi:hypothetical protein